MLKIRIFSLIKKILYPWRRQILSNLDKYRFVVKSIDRLKRLILGRVFHKERGASKYSIVSACYNVSQYIDDFIESIIYQSLDFEKNIQLILINDGSTDDTAINIARWVK